LTMGYYFVSTCRIICSMVSRPADASLASAQGREGGRQQKLQ
jgi:hypothetical protein